MRFGAMKLAILSDFHLGYDRFREDAYRQAEEALTLASSVADALLLPGDLFDIRAPKPEVLAEAINLFRNLKKKEWSARVAQVEAEGKAYTTVPVVAIPGTHERRAQRMENPVNLLALAGMLVDVSDGFAIIEKDGERVAVHGIGGVSDEQFLETIKRVNPKPTTLFDALVSVLLGVSPIKNPAVAKFAIVVNLTTYSQFTFR